MGYDDIRFAVAYPDLGISEGDAFQTKSLCGNCEQFSITADGELVEHFRYYVRSDGTGKTPKDFTIKERVVEHHGDLLLYGKYLYELIVRFTHGKVEWIQRFPHPPGTDYSANPEDIPLTAEQSAEIKCRIELLDLGKEQFYSWEEVRGRLKNRNCE